MTEIQYRLEQVRRLDGALPGPKSRELSERRAATVASGVASSVPAYAADVDGGIVLDVDGNQLVDLGSGKGRVLLVAQEFPFKRIVGVEWSGELHAIAQTNVAIAAVSGQAPDARFELLQMDAAAYAFPTEPLVVFLFNPFGAATMAHVVANLELTLAAYPRRVIVIYANPLHGDFFAQSAAFRTIAATRADALFESVAR